MRKVMKIGSILKHQDKLNKFMKQAGHDITQVKLSQK